MILLDTNVVSELMRARPEPTVQACVNNQVPETLLLSSITVAELLYGVGVLPDGQRKRDMTTKVDRMLDLFASRILPFDNLAARCHADRAVSARAAGLGFPAPDSYIAAIAAAHGFAVATRDPSAFVAAGVSVINPWA